MLYFSRLKVAGIILICLASLLFALPNFISKDSLNALPEWMPNKAVNLGLDLRGGSHLLLQIDYQNYLSEQMQTLSGDVRAGLRAERIGFQDLTTQANGVNFALRNTEDQQKLIEVASDIDPELKMESEDGRISIFYPDEWLSKRKELVLQQSIEIVNRRVNETGTTEPIIQRQGDDRIVVQVPGLEDPERLKNLLGQTAKMTFHLLNNNITPLEMEKKFAPPGTVFLPEDERSLQEGEELRYYPIRSRVMLSGDLLVDSQPTFDQQTGEPVVSFRFNAVGAKKFAKVTSDNVGKPFAIVLDGKVITAPVIRSPIIGGNGIISGGFSVQAAQDLALLLRAGALPAPLTVLEERTVGPSLGSDSIDAGTQAAMFSVLLVAFFMILFYRLFGIFANIALLLNGTIILALLSMLQATLTLPGIAGIVLTLGMAVDANVLIFERIKEEIRNGKTVFSATETGFKMAFNTILDSNITTLTAALILYYFGTGTIQGFAVTLSIGIIASMFTAILITRLLVATWLQKTKPKTLPI